MSVAVVVPLYNGGPWIEEALQGVFAQEVAPEVVVVVDDGSTDDGPERVRGFPDATLVPNRGKGSSVARNTGLEHVRSRYVAFLDQDDVWHPAHLGGLVEVLDAHPGAAAAFADADCFSGPAPSYRLDGEGLRCFDPWTRFPFTVGVDGPSLALVRTQAVHEVGLWEECATGMGDILLFLKLAVLHPLLHRTDRTVGKRIHESQQWLQIRELGAHYLGKRHGVMRRALDFRRDQSPDDPELHRHERRLAALGTLRELTLAIEADRLEALPRLADALEDALGGEAATYLPHVFYCLMGALFKTHDAEQLRIERDGVFLELLEHWPASAPRTRAAMEGRIGELPHVS
jgi:glycosyltransferase involved in cell wall biosynthesis